jgi:hypothetical protein
MDVYANKRFKKLFSSNNIIDVSVDLGLILFDVLSSPILIVVRLLRYIFNKFFKKFLVKGIKKIIVMLKGKNER